MERKSRWIFLCFHIAAAAGILLFPYYRTGAELLSAFVSFCVFHDAFHLYCPLCGGTRAAEALLHGDLAGAFRFNPIVLLLAGLLLLWYVFAWVRVIRKKSIFQVLPAWVWIAFGAVLLVFFLLRNFLLVCFGIDTIGDLAGFWNG